MTDAAATTLTAIQAVQSALTIIYGLDLTPYRYPTNCDLTNGSYYDYIVVGGGTAGSVVASRLSENSSNTVLLIEAGSYPPIESEIAGMFTTMPRSAFDYDTWAVNDSYTAQNLQSSCVSLTQGKMLGGSSSIDHMIYVQGDTHDYDNWAIILDDDSWKYENVLPYFKKAENLTDADLSATAYADLHGTDGMIKIGRQIANVSSYILEAFAELGHRTVEDTTSLNSSLGATNPLFAIGNDLRQSNAYCYLGPAKSRPNLCLAVSTSATKVLIVNNTAVGVQVNTSSGEALVMYANKEVIVSAGAIHSPKLLMLSGVGPKSHLESLEIPVIADLPVGQNFMDHPVCGLLYTMKETTEAIDDPHKFPVPTTTLYVALNSSQTYPDYQTINLVFPPASGALLQLCSNVFKYSNDICNKFAAANTKKTGVFVVHNLMLPDSRGYVKLASNDSTVDPLVYTGTYSNNSDLVLMTECLADFNKVLNITYFEQNEAALVDTGLCTGKTDSEFWECYALNMSATMWHYSGTCAMGSVVDTEMKVKGIEDLRVIDASVMPTEVSGNIRAAVTMIAERDAAFILADL